MKILIYTVLALLVILLVFKIASAAICFKLLEEELEEMDEDDSETGNFGIGYPERNDEGLETVDARLEDEEHRRRDRLPGRTGNGIRTGTEDQDSQRNNPGIEEQVETDFGFTVKKALEENEEQRR